MAYRKNSILSWRWHGEKKNIMLKAKFISLRPQRSRGHYTFGYKKLKSHRTPWEEMLDISSVKILFLELLKMCFVQICVISNFPFPWILQREFYQPLLWILYPDMWILTQWSVETMKKGRPGPMTRSILCQDWSPPWLEFPSNLITHGHKNSALRYNPGSISDSSPLNIAQLWWMFGELICVRLPAIWLRSHKWVIFLKQWGRLSVGQPQKRN